MWTLRLLRALILASLSAGSVAAQPAPTVPVIDVYHGVAVVDPYRWLENKNDPRVQAWSRAQTARARTHLDGLPARPAIKARLSALMTGTRRRSQISRRAAAFCSPQYPTTRSSARYWS